MRIYWLIDAYIFITIIFYFATTYPVSIQPNLVQIESQGDFVKWECSVDNPENDLRMHFYYENSKDKSTNSRWFENCGKIGTITAKINCSSIFKNNKLIVIFDIDKSTMPSGSYYCEYRNSKSSEIKHIRKEKPTPTMVVSTLPSTTDHPVKQSFLPVQLIFLFLGIFILSFLLNVFFLIRCCIVKCYLDKYYHVSRPRQFSEGLWTICFCLKEELKARDIYYKIKEDPYEKIHDHISSENSKSKSSFTNEYLRRPMSQETEKLCLSSSNSQISRSSTFPARQSVIVQTPTDQFSVSAIPGNMIDCFQNYMIQYVMDPNTKTLKPVLNPVNRLSSHCLYDDVPGERNIENSSSTMPIRHFSSTGSLNSRQRQVINSSLMASPLAEENQLNYSNFNKNNISDEEQGLIMNDCSSVLQDFSSSDETYLSGKDNDSMKDPVRVAKLEMSREMMAKADTLLREAHNLLKVT